MGEGEGGGDEGHRKGVKLNKKRRGEMGRGAEGKGRRKGVRRKKGEKIKNSVRCKDYRVGGRGMRERGLKCSLHPCSFRLRVL